MPDTDVLIKPIYKKIEVPNTPDNPKTGRYYLFGILVLIVFTKNYKKKRA